MEGRKNEKTKNTNNFYRKKSRPVKDNIFDKIFVVRLVKSKAKILRKV